MKKLKLFLYKGIRNKKILTVVNFLFLNKFLII